MGLFDFGKKEKPKKKAPKKVEFEPETLGIKFRTIIEVMGAPKKYVDDTIKAFIAKIKSNRDYVVLKTKISNAKKVKEIEKKESAAEDIKEDLFISFVELEVGVKKKEKIFDFCFNFMPSSIEIIEPMNISFSANELSGYLSDIQATLHKVDFMLKRVNGVNQILTKKNENLIHNTVRILRNNVLLSLKEKSKDLKEISKNVGLTENDLKPFIENMIKDNEIKLIKDKYSPAKP